MVRIIKTRFQDYKLLLNKRKKTLKVSIRFIGEKQFTKHIFAIGLTKNVIEDIEEMSDMELLHFIRHDRRGYSL